MNSKYTTQQGSNAIATSVSSAGAENIEDLLQEDDTNGQCQEEVCSYKLMRECSIGNVDCDKSCSQNNNFCRLDSDKDHRGSVLNKSSHCDNIKIAKCSLTKLNKELCKETISKGKDSNRVNLDCNELNNISKEIEICNCSGNDVNCTNSLNSCDIHNNVESLTSGVQSVGEESLAAKLLEDNLRTDLKETTDHSQDIISNNSSPSSATDQEEDFEEELVLTCEQREKASKIDLLLEDNIIDISALQELAACDGGFISGNYLLLISIASILQSYHCIQHTCVFSVVSSSVLHG